MAGGTGSLEARSGDIGRAMRNYRILTAITCSVTLYTTGVFFNIVRTDLLKGEHSGVVQRIHEIERLTPMMKEDFAKSYADSLKQLREERNELSQRIAEEDSRIFYSWTNYLR